MTSKTSLRKKNVGLNLFTFTIRKNLGLILLFCFAQLLICPGYLLIYINRGISKLSTVLYAYMIGSSIFGSIAVLIFLYLAFSYLYSKRSSDLFHPLPLKRSSLLLSRFFGAVVSAIIPITLGFLSFSMITLFAGKDIGVATVLLGYLYTVLGILLIASVLLIFTVCAAGTLDLILSFFGVNIGLLIIGAILESTLEYSIRGYSADYAILKYFSPLWWFYGKELTFLELDLQCDISVLWFVIKALIMTAIFAAVAVLLYTKRKAERSESSYAYRFIYYICTAIVTFVSAYAIGMIFSAGEADAVFWIFSALGAVLISVAFGAISNRSFKKVPESLIIAGISFAVLVGSYFAINFDIFGIGRYVPNADNVSSVKVTALGETVTVKDDIKAVTDIHKAVIDSPDPSENGVTTGCDNRPETYLELEYTLKNKTVVHRVYEVYEKDVISIVPQLLSGEEKHKELIEKCEKSAGDISLFYQTYSENGDYNSISYSVEKKDIIELLDVYYAEIKEVDFEKLYSVENDTSEITCSLSRNNTEYGKPLQSFTLKINEDFKKTLDFLSKLNIKEEPEIIQYDYAN